MHQIVRIHSRERFAALRFATFVHKLRSMRVPLIILLIVVLVASCEAPRVDRVIQPGEYLLVKGEIHVCPYFGEYITEVAQVEESGVKLFDYVISAAGSPQARVQDQLIEAIGEKTGRRPETLKIEVISEEQFLARKSEIDKEISLFYKAIERCEREKEKLENERNLEDEGKKAVACSLHGKSLEADAVNVAA